MEDKFYSTEKLLKLSKTIFAYRLITRAEAFKI